jgi:hypothetical protein
MTLFELDLHGSKFAIPKRRLFNFFDHHPELFNTASYKVTTPVPVPVFEQFATAVRSKTRINIRNITENDDYIRLLAKELYCEDLLFDCSSPAGTSELRSLEEQIAVYKDEIKALRSRLSTVEADLNALMADFEAQSARQEAELSELRIPADHSRSDPNYTSPPPPIKPKTWKPVEITDEAGIESMKKSGPEIRRWLCWKCRGNAVDLGLVSVTMKSIDRGHAWLSARGFFDPYPREFRSHEEPGQWVCFDFKEMRIHLTHYVITRQFRSILSWVLEMSIDGTNWREIDRQTNVPKIIHGMDTVRFDIADCPEGRFLRLTQTGPNQAGSDMLSIFGLDLFGTLLEYRE